MDDEPGVCDTIASYLRERRCDVIAAHNGAHALDVIKDTIPDLIILDVMMPVMDGFQLLEKIRKHPSYSKIPVIMLTVRSEPEYFEKGISLKADFYLPKPFKLKNLNNFINLILKG